MKLRLLRTLLLRKKIQRGRPAHVSSASGLVLGGSQFYVVADDENHLAAFSIPKSKSMGHAIEVFPGALPLDFKDRKKAKPDLEALAVIESGYGAKNGGLLLVPSGSKTNRIRGAFLPWDGKFKPQKAQKVDFALLFRKLGKKINDLNIEGIVIRKEEVRLYHRGNGHKSQNALIILSAKSFFRALKKKKFSGSMLKSIHKFDLGKIKGHRLAFTDATAFNADCDLFIAAAEATDNAYNDGEFMGAYIGVIHRRKGVLKKWKLQIEAKPEGLVAAPGQKNVYWLVTDADDAGKPACLYELRLPELKGL